MKQQRRKPQNEHEREGERTPQIKADEGCQSIMEQLLKHGFSYQVGKNEVENAIIRADLGRDERTWKRWIRTLEALEYIKSTQTNIYEMNILKVPHLFAILKNLPQTHLSTLSLSHTSETKQL